MSFQPCLFAAPATSCEKCLWGETSYCYMTLSPSTDVPSAPGKPDVMVQSTTSASLTWTLPTTDGGSRITHYIIEYRMQGFLHWREEKTSTANTSFTVPGLSKGSMYTFRVKAVNKAGPGEPSDETEPVQILPAGCK